MNLRRVKQHIRVATLLQLNNIFFYYNTIVYCILHSVIIQGSGDFTDTKGVLYNDSRTIYFYQDDWKVGFGSHFK